MSPLSSLLLLIVAAAAPAPTGPRSPHALELYRCDFDAVSDRNYDLWPDGWTRQGGAGYPKYVQMAIQADRSLNGLRALRIELDGGAGGAYSPPIACHGLVSFVLEGELRTIQLQHDRAFLSLTFLDQKRHPLQTISSERVALAPDWRRLRVGPVAPADPRVAYAQIGLHLEPQSSTGRHDIRGTAAFTRLWLGCLPRVTLSTDAPGNLFAVGQPVTIACRVSGFAAPPPSVEFTLEDAAHKQLAREVRTLDVVPLRDDKPAEQTAEKLAEETSEQQEQRKKLAQRHLAGALAWKPLLPGPGFYRVRARLHGADELPSEHALTLATFTPRNAAFESEFGWELRRGADPLGLKLLGTILAQAGVHWVKLPVWPSAGASAETLGELRSFCEGLAPRNMELVGMLSEPPAEVRALLPDISSPAAADVFTLPPAKWYPSLEPLLAHMAGQIRYWQLGTDADASFVGCANLPAQMNQVRDALSRLGADAQVGLGWDWLQQLPGGPEGRPPFRFLALSTQPSLTPAELGAYLQATRAARCQRWVNVECLDRDAYPNAVRIADLVECLIAAKMHDAEGIIAGDALNPRRGLLEADGSPGELFLPWRTTALVLGGARWLGSLELPRGSRGEVFSRGDDAVLAVWARNPTTETVYLGEELRQIDVWGRSRTLRGGPQAQTIEVERLPSFVTGVKPAVVRWALDCTLSPTRFPSAVGKAHATAVRLKNHFASSIVGRAEVVPPAGWTVEPREVHFHLDRGEAVEKPLRFTLPLDASAGRHAIRVDYELRSDRPLQFSVFRHVDVGGGDVAIEIRTHLNADGQLEVEQCLVNDTPGKVSFRCELFAPDRKRQRWDVLNLGSTRDVHVYYFPDGKGLLGRPLLLRAEEIAGPRILNYRFTAEK